MFRAVHLLLLSEEKSRLLRLNAVAGSRGVYFENLTVFLFRGAHPDVFSQHKVKTHLVLLARYDVHTDSQGHTLITRDAFTDASLKKIFF